VGAIPGSPGHSGTPAWGGGGGSGWFGGTWIKSGYTTRGPYWWAFDTLWNRLGAVAGTSGALDATHFMRYERTISNIKLGYMFGLTPQKIRYNYRIITDYQKAQEYVQAEDARRLAAHRLGQSYVSHIIHTRYYRVSLGSSISWHDDRWLCDPKTYSVATHIATSPGELLPDRASHWIWEPRGWHDLGGNQRLANKPNNRPDIQEWFFDRLNTASRPVWRLLVHQYLPYDRAAGALNTIEDLRINLHARFNPDTGDPINWHIYGAVWYVFGGLQVYEETSEITNPFNWSDEGGLPAPYLLDTPKGEYADDHDLAGRRDVFTLLGVARADDTPPLWRGQFGSLNPSKSMVTVAQAEVFNNASWDLWTQKWQAQLVPVSQWAGWMSRMTDDSPPAGSPVQPADVQAVRDYLMKIDPKMVDTYMNH
jgi:hypothetical protein